MDEQWLREFRRTRNMILAIVVGLGGVHAYKYSYAQAEVDEWLRFEGAILDECISIIDEEEVEDMRGDA